MQDNSINSEGAALLGSAELINIVSDWDKTERISSLLLSFNATSGVVRRLKGAKWLAVAVQGSVTVFTQELEHLYYFPWNAQYERSSILLAPSTQGLVYVLPSCWLIYNLNSGLAKQRAVPLFDILLEAEVLIVPCEDKDKHYIVTLGFSGDQRKLYSNYKLLDTGVSAIRVCNPVLLVFRGDRNLTLYKANIDCIYACRSFKCHDDCYYSTNLHFLTSAYFAIFDRNLKYELNGFRVSFISYECKEVLIKLILPPDYMNYDYDIIRAQGFNSDIILLRTSNLRNRHLQIMRVAARLGYYSGRYMY